MTIPDQALESAIVAAGATKAPRITPADITANIVHTEIVKHLTPTGKVLRWAVLTCKNGFAVTGKPSASVSVENDRATIGEDVAISNAREEMWALMGYELQSKLAAPPQPWICGSCCMTSPDGLPKTCLCCPDGSNGCNAALAKGV